MKLLRLIACLFPTVLSAQTADTHALTVGKRVENTRLPVRPTTTRWPSTRVTLSLSRWWIPRRP